MPCLFKVAYPLTVTELENLVYKVNKDDALSCDSASETDDHCENKENAKKSDLI